MSPSSEFRIALIGAGSASFGRGMIADVMSRQDLRDFDCTLILVDTNEESLDRMTRLAELIRRHRDSPVEIQATPDRTEALPGADFVILSVARRRYELWEQDFRIPLAHGFRHVLGENGGPGALFHALRSFEIVVPICRDVETLCPNALVLNFTNPEGRVLMAIKELTKANAVGLCHGVLSTRDEIARLLDRDLEDLRIIPGGLNHFFWILKVEDAKTGEDLYPLLRERARESCPPLAKKMLDVFGYFIFPSDDHIGEYLSFAHEFTEPLWPYGLESRRIATSESTTTDWRDEYLSGKRPVDEELVRPSGEIAVSIIADILNDENRWEPSVDVMNEDGYIENLPRHAVVEVPAVVNSNGIHPEHIGALPEPLAALCRIQVSIQNLIVEAYRRRSRELLLQALLLDPVVDSIKQAEKLLDHMLELQKDFMPSFV